MKTAKWNLASAAVAMAVASALAPMVGSAEAAGKGQEKNNDWSMARSTQYETYEMGVDGVWWKPTFLLVGSEQQWDEAMQQMVADDALMALPAPQAPQVDWSRKCLVLVSLGALQHRGYMVQVSQTLRRGNRLLVTASVQVPATNMYCASYAPYHMVVVDRRGLRQAELNYELALPNRSVYTNQAAAASGMGLDGLGTGAVAPLDQETTQTSWGAVKGLYR